MKDCFCSDTLIKESAYSKIIRQASLDGKKIIVRTISGYELECNNFELEEAYPGGINIFNFSIDSEGFKEKKLSDFIPFSAVVCISVRCKNING